MSQKEPLKGKPHSQTRIIFCNRQSVHPALRHRNRKLQMLDPRKVKVIQKRTVFRKQLLFGQSDLLIQMIAIDKKSIQWPKIDGDCNAQRNDCQKQHCIFQMKFYSTFHSSKDPNSIVGAISCFLTSSRVETPV